MNKDIYFSPSLRFRYARVSLLFMASFVGFWMMLGFHWMHLGLLSSSLFFGVMWILFRRFPYVVVSESSLSVRESLVSCRIVEKSAVTGCDETSRELIIRMADGDVKIFKRNVTAEDVASVKAWLG